MADRGPGRARRSGETEFGGEVGSIQSADKGHEMTAAEKARVARSYGIRTPSGEVRLDGEPWDVGVARRAEAEGRMSGRTPEETL